MTTSNLWDQDVPAADFGVDVPEWIESDISCTDIAAIVQGGCASGAYMPAVTYHQAAQIMAAHGDNVLEFIEDNLGELPTIPAGESWSGIAVFFLSYAVELWASSIEYELSAAIDEKPKFSAGWNSCGYMPDNDPAEFPEFDDARDSIVEELESRAEELRTRCAEIGLVHTDEKEAEKMAADWSDLAGEFEQAAQYASEQGSAFSVVVGGFAFWVAAI